MSFIKKTILLLISTILLSGCSVVRTIDKLTDFNFSDNPNNADYEGYKGYGGSLNKSSDSINTSLRNKRREAFYKTLSLLKLLNKLSGENNLTTDHKKLLLDSVLLAEKAVEIYKNEAVEYDSTSEIRIAEEALTKLKIAIDCYKNNKPIAAESEIKLALLYLIDDKVLLWQYQQTGEQKFPAYLNWGDTTESKTDNIIENPDTLAFSGGGAKGTAYAGVLKYLQETGKLKNVDRFIGTSVGSIMCTFMSIGMYYETNRKPGDKCFWEVIYEIMEDKNFFNFIGNNVLKQVIKKNNFTPVTRNIFTSVPLLLEDIDNQYAFCTGNRILEFFKKSLVRFGLDGDITLAELHRKTGKHLVLIACSLSYRKAAYFDYLTAPNLSVAEAMRASMAIPFIFKPVKYNNDFFVDGGAVNNYPINYFDLNGTEDGSTPKTLGFILYSKDEMLKPEWKPIKDPVDYAKAVFNLIMINTGSALYKKNVDRTVFINCGKIDVMSFNMTKSEKQKLMQSGYDAVKNYFEVKK